MSSIFLSIGPAGAPGAAALTLPVTTANIDGRLAMTEQGALDPGREAELVERYRATGDRRWFAELYRLTRRRVFAVCLRRVGDPARAEDLCHDAYVRAFEAFDRFQGTTFAAWVCRIAIHLALNELRNRSVRERAAREAIPATTPAATPATAERAALSREAIERARGIVAGLDARQRRVFLLRHLDELSYDEIARRTGWSWDQVRSYLQNARRNFRLAWRQTEEVSDG